MDYLPSEILTMGNSLISDLFLTAIPYGLSNYFFLAFLSRGDNFFFFHFLIGLLYPFYILFVFGLLYPFFLLWVAGTYVDSVTDHTQQNSLWTCILPNTIPGIKPGEKYSNVNFVTNHTLQKSVWIIISMPYMVRNEMLSKSVVIFDRDPADLLFPISIWTFLSLFYSFSI